MKMVPVPNDLYRAHWNSEGPLEPSPRTGACRWDDYRREPRYHVLYTADSPVGALIEKLQVYRGSDFEAFEILYGTDEIEDPIPLPERDTVPESVLRETAVSHLKVHDDCGGVVDPCDLATIDEMCALAPRYSITDFEAPRPRSASSVGAGPSPPRPPKPPDLLGSDFSLPQRASVIIFESQPRAAGIVSLSSLENPRANTSHSNFNLFRETPENGAGLRAYVERLGTALAVVGYRKALEEALTYLQARAGRPLDDFNDL